MLAAPKLPETIASRYLPVRVIGRGGMGVVYEVVHARTGEHLALKVLQFGAGPPAEALARFKREARAPAQIKSEHVVHISDADVAPELDDAPFLVMELLVGTDLEVAASESPPDPATVVAWLRQIAPALDKAHHLGIIHRDLKPENLFLSRVEGRPPIVKILDFGIAKMAEEDSAATVSGQVLGTPKYMAPEQADRHPRVTPATDRYALGLIAYRLLAGESYYRGPVMSILAELLHGAATAPSTRKPSLGAAFDAWFAQACHREPERRFASAAIQVEALADALGLPSNSESTQTPGFGRLLFLRNKPRRILVAGLVLLATLTAVLWYRASTTRTPIAAFAPSRPAPTVAVHAAREQARGKAAGPVDPPDHEAPRASQASPAVAALPPSAPAASGMAPEAVRARVPAPLTQAKALHRTTTQPVRSAVSPPKSQVSDPFSDQK